MYETGEVHSLQSWLARLPQTIINSRANLLVTMAWMSPAECRSISSVDRELERIRKILPSHQVAILPGAGRWFQEDAPDETIHAIRAWWTDIVNPSSNE
jgi:pimeloyl-ACP methyl ester carboxylesterase